MLERIKGMKGLLYRKIKGLEKKEKAELPGFTIKKTTHIAEFPEVADIKEIDVTYPLLEPFAYAKIKWNEETKELIYYVIEPQMSKEELELLKKISETLIEMIEVDISSLKEHSKAIDYLEKNVSKIIKSLGLNLTTLQYAKFMYYLYRNFVGYNQIEPLLQDPNIEDISCDGVNIPIYVIHRKYGSLKTNVIFSDPNELRQFIVKLAERCGRYVSYAEPILDATLPDGSRVAATLASDVATRGATFTIRKFPEKPFSITEQVKLKTASTEILAYLWYLIEHKASILVVGGVATGKCIAPHDPIQLATGELKPIEEIFNEVLNKSGGDISLITMTQDLKLVPMRVNKFFKLVSPQVLIKVKTETGCELTTTPEHTFFCLKDGNVKKIRSDQIKVGDYVAAPRILNIKGKTQKIEFLEWADDNILITKPKGLVLKVIRKAKEKYGNLAKLAKAENWSYENLRMWYKGKALIPIQTFLKLCRIASVDLRKIEREIKSVKCKKSKAEMKLPKRTTKELLKILGYLLASNLRNCIEFSNQSSSLRKDFLRLVSKVFGIRGKENFQNSKKSKVVIKNVTLALFLKRTFGLFAKEKDREIPQIVFKCKKSEIREFIKAIFDSRGSVSEKECGIILLCKSEKLIYGLASLLRRFGIIGKIGKEEFGNSVYYQLLISGIENLRRYEKIFGFTDCEKKKLVKKIMAKARYEDERLDGKKIEKGATRGINTHIFWDRVKEVKRVKGTNYVYDFTVDFTHNFVAGRGGGLIVSNTSFLNTICSFIPLEAKIVSIEDTREIKIPHQHWIPNLARTGFGIPMPTGEKYGTITLFELLKESFRQNPDYLIVGEARGEETYVMFQGMASGHPSIATFHAGSVDTVMRRLTSPPINLSPTLIESLDVAIVMTHAKEKGKSARRIKEVVEIVSVDPKTAEVKTNVVFRWNPATDEFEKVNESIKVKKFALARGEDVEEALREIERRKIVLDWICQKGISEYEEVTKLINLYRKDPKKMEEMMGEFAKKLAKPLKVEEKKEEREEIEKKELPEKKKRRATVLELLGDILGR